MKNKYVLVFHNWFISSNSFEVVEIEAESLKDAEKQGLIRLGKHQTFNHRDFTVVEMEPEYQLARKKLTWKERFSGYISKGH